MSNPAAAAEQLAVVTKARPDSELAWVGYGRALTSQRRAADALRVLDEAVKRLPQSAEARFERGIALQNVNRVPEAEQNFIEALNLGLDARNGAIAYNNLGSYAAQRQEIAQAQKYFEQAFKLDLGFALAHRNYAMTLVAQKQLQKAIDHLQRKAVLWTNNDRLVGEYLAALMTQNYQEQYKKEQEQVALEKAAEKKAAEKK
jgi:Flp pilus assembly protein TadD